MKQSSKVSSIIKVINNLMQEFDASHTKPNVLFITSSLLNDIKEFFPYLINGSVFTYNDVKLNIVITETDIVGLAFSFYYATPYVEGSSNEGT